MLKVKTNLVKNEDGIQDILVEFEEDKSTKGEYISVIAQLLNVLEEKEGITIDNVFEIIKSMNNKE